MIINSGLPSINNLPGGTNKIGEKSTAQIDKNEKIPAADIDAISANARQLTAAENINAAQSPLRDPEAAREVLDFTRENILADVSTAIDAHGRKPVDAGNLLGE